MPHVLSVRVVPEDIDELGHASNIVYLRWVQEAAVSHSTAVGLGPGEYKALGYAFVVIRHEIDYLGSALEGDALLVETRVTQMGAATSERRTTIRRHSDGAVLCQAVTRWAFLDLKRGRPVRMPEEIRGRFTLEPIEARPSSEAPPPPETEPA